MAKTRDREAWRKLVAAFHQSKDSVEEFCARREIKTRTFNWWRWKLASTPVLSPIPEITPNPMRLVEVNAIAGQREASIELVLEVRGIVIRVRDASPAYVADLVAEICARC